MPDPIRGMTDPTKRLPEKTALFVRIPAASAKKLEQHAKREGRSKQDIVANLILQALQKPPITSSTPSPDVSPPETPEIMTLAELSVYLRVDENELQQKVNAGELPVRRFGEEWRFSRQAIDHWMEGTDRPSKRTTGFTSRQAT
jgi:excisionase family DNA binding protein